MSAFWQVVGEIELVPDFSVHASLPDGFIVDGAEVDVTCAGRFYDFLEWRDGRWGVVRRQPAYEKDRLDPVDPAAGLRPHMGEGGRPSEDL